MLDRRMPVVFACLLVVAVPSAVLGFQEIVPVQKYSGIVRQTELKKLAPESNMIASSQQLKILWSAWNIQEKLPNVDFTTMVALVATVDGPNRTISGPLRLQNGKLDYKVLSTKRGGPGFGFMIMLIERDGIQQVNGVPLPESKQLPPKVIKPTVEDLIRVDLIGTIETGLMVVGGETTGTVIRANGIEWELDFQSADQLKIARQLHGQKARVKGVYFEVPGTEVKMRSIVSVSDLNSAKAELLAAGRPRPATGQQGKVEGRPEVQAPSLPTNQPVTTPNVAEPVIDISKLRAFSTIQYNIKLTDNNRTLVQSIDSKGNVTLVVDGEKEIWQIKPTRLKTLHNLVDMTNWKDYPRVNRSTNSGGIEYSIKISTPRGATRIFVDGGALKDQPLIVKMFDLMKRR